MLEILSSHPMYFEASLLLVSIASGAVGAMLGLGGGMILVPILALLFRMKIQYAMGASIVSVIATSSGAAATYVKDHMTNVRLAMLLAVAASVGGWSGAMLSTMVNTRYLFLLFSLMLILSSFFMMKPIGEPTTETGELGDPLAERLKLNANYRDERSGRTIAYTVSNVGLGLVSMVGVGLLTGLLGVGCGALRVPVMDRVMRLPIKVSSATSNFIIGITSTVSAVALYLHGHVIFLVAAPVAVGVLLGSWTGMHWMTRVSSTFLRRLFLVILLLMAGEMLLHTFGLFGRHGAGS